jgi:hypothetical protein
VRLTFFELFFRINDLLFFFFFFFLLVLLFSFTLLSTVSPPFFPFLVILGVFGIFARFVLLHTKCQPKYTH